MPQIAQQDYLRIAIADLEAPTAEEKAEIQKHVQNGTIWDCLIAYSAETPVSRVVAITEGDQSIFIFDTGTEAIIAVSYAE